MPAPACTDEQFLHLWGQLRSATSVAKVLGVNVRNVNARRRALESRLNISLPANDIRSAVYYKLHEPPKTNAVKRFSLLNGTVFVFSDAHFWPGIRTTAFKGLLYLARQLKPSAIVCNGDAFDGAGISRHPRIGWDSKPTVQEELRACRDRLAEIAEAAGDARKFWPLGNHDSRYETFLAAHAPQYEGVGGFTLRDKFPDWDACWSLWINDDTVVKHRFKGGLHATHNNTLWSGKTIVTGHLHSLKVTPFDDMNGTRWGVDTGTLADPHGPQFEDYLETNPTNWRSGFAILKFKDGQLMWPQLVSVPAPGVIEYCHEHFDVSGE